MENSKKNINKIPSQYMLEKRKNEMIILFFVTTILTFIINYIFYKYSFLPSEYFTISIVFTLIIPIITSLYSAIYHINFEKTHTEAEALDELKKENSLEKESKIPIILFGLGIFITKLKKKYITVIFPYLIYSLVFGTIIVEVLNHFIFDYNNLDRLIFVEELEFASIMLSYGFLIMGIYLTRLFHHEK
jgi:hypothetical protein